MTAQFVSDFNQITGQTVGYLEADYSPQEFFKRTQHLANEPEGGDRCKVCYDYRLDKTAEKVVELSFDYFGSALTISPHKNAQTINAVGIEVQKLYDTQYLPSDFKKNGGYSDRFRCVKNTIFIASATVAVFMGHMPKVSILFR